MNRRCKICLVIISVVIGYCVLSGKQFNPESIRGQRVLVTGASSGIGEQVAYRYAELGARLVITARRAELLSKVAKRCAELGAQEVHAVPTDMSSPDERKMLVETTVRRLKSLDILILNHAILTPCNVWKSTAHNMSYLADVLNVNFIAFVDITSRLLKHLETNRGYIGVVSSVAGKLGLTCFTQYSASKHAVQGFFSSLRQEHRLRKTGVSVTVIVYGAVYTEKANELIELQNHTTFDFKAVASDARDAADALVSGVATGDYEVYFPLLTSRVLQWFISLFPGYAEYCLAWQMGNING